MPTKIYNLFAKTSSYQGEDVGEERLKLPQLTRRRDLSLKYKKTADFQSAEAYSYPAGFTLIELLVTIGIIGIVFGIIINSASGIQKAGRDSQRQTDLRTIQQALQQYYADQNFYPRSSNFSLTGADTTMDSCDGREDGFTCVASSKKTYLSTIPKDPFPSGTNSYLYVALDRNNSISPACDNNTTSTRCFRYCLYAQLENSSSSNIPLQCGGSFGQGARNFAVLQP